MVCVASVIELVSVRLYFKHHIPTRSELFMCSSSCSHRVRSRYLWMVLVTVFLVSCQAHNQEQKSGVSNQEDDQAKASQVEKETPVEVHRLTRGSISSSVKAVAILSPKERASVRSLISGLITELYTEEGDQVKAKQKLAHLSRPGAKSLIQKAIGLYQKSRRDVQRLKVLVKKGLAPREELTQAKFSRDQSALELTRLRDEAKNEQITSPINGVIVKRPVYRGETVSPGQVIFEVMDLSTVYAPLNLPDRWSTKVQEGMKASLYDRQGQLLSSDAVVTHVSPIIDANTGTFSVWVSPRPDHQRAKKSKRKTSRRKKHRSQKSLDPFTVNSSLKPGLFVTVQVILDRKEDTVIMPRKAVTYTDGVPFVATVVDDRIKLVKIEIGYTERERLEVLSPLKKGDIVVTFGQRGLETGTLIKPIWAADQFTHSTQHSEDHVESLLKR